MQAETLLYQLAAQRPTTYVTTVTPERKVREAVDGIAGVGGADGLDTVAVAPDASVASFAERLDVREDSYVLVDAVDLFERSDPADYHAFLGEFADRLDERGPSASSTPSRAPTCPRPATGRSGRPTSSSGSRWPSRASSRRRSFGSSGPAALTRPRRR
ncbi:hypothetical protein [Halosegnis marinus]|uniref:hypothetical protein n=1 Tax=Halosegnis marinus TaxID=3034023 RepID=UPI00361190D1